MARDYATKTRGKPRKKAKPSSGRRKAAPATNHGMTYMVVGLLIGLLIAGLAYLKLNPSATSSPQKTVSSQTTAPKKAVKPSRDSKKATADKPQFDFYTMLPNMQVSTGNEPTASKTKPPAKKPDIPLPAQTANYVLQVASFSQPDDAETLKAQLAMLGYQATITPAKARGKTWYRVFIGPYGSLKAAKADQVALKRNNKNSIIVTKKSA